jgi:hypothetical protein
MERKPYDPRPDETRFEQQEEVNYVIEREDDHNKARKSRRRQLIEIQEALGWEANPVEVGNLLKFTKKETDRYLSRRGIRDAEFEEIQEILTGYHTIALMLTKIYPGLHAFVQRRALLANTNDFLLQQTGVNAMKTGKPDMIIAQLEANHMFHEVAHPE